MRQAIAAAVLALLATATLLAQHSPSVHPIILTIRAVTSRGGVPQIFLITLQNTTDHDIRFPTPALDCADAPHGFIRLQFFYRPANKNASPTFGMGCFADCFFAPLSKRVQDWVTLAPGKKLTFRDSLSAAPKGGYGAGVYTYSVNYTPPSTSKDEKAELTQSHIDFPQEDLSTDPVRLTLR